MIGEEDITSKTTDDRDSGIVATGVTRRVVTGALALAPIALRSALGATSSSDPSFFDGAKLSTAYQDRSLSPVEVTSAVFKRVDALNPAVNAFIVIDREG